MKLTGLLALVLRLLFAAVNEARQVHINTNRPEQLRDLARSLKTARRVSVLRYLHALIGLLEYQFWKSYLTSFGHYSGPGPYSRASSGFS